MQMDARVAAFSALLVGVGEQRLPLDRAQLARDAWGLTGSTATQVVASSGVGAGVEKEDNSKREIRVEEDHTKATTTAASRQQEQGPASLSYRLLRGLGQHWSSRWASTQTDPLHNKKSSDSGSKGAGSTPASTVRAGGRLQFYQLMLAGHADLGSEAQLLLTSARMFGAQAPATASTQRYAPAIDAVVLGMMAASSAVEFAATTGDGCKGDSASVSPAVATLLCTAAGIATTTSAAASAATLQAAPQRQLLLGCLLYLESKLRAPGIFASSSTSSSPLSSSVAADEGCDGTPDGNSASSSVKATVTVAAEPAREAALCDLLASLAFVVATEISSSSAAPQQLFESFLGFFAAIAFRMVAQLIPYRALPSLTTTSTTTTTTTTRAGGLLAGVSVPTLLAESGATELVRLLVQYHDPSLSLHLDRHPHNAARYRAAKEEKMMGAEAEKREAAKEEETANASDNCSDSTHCIACFSMSDAYGAFATSLGTFGARRALQGLLHCHDVVKRDLAAATAMGETTVTKTQDAANADENEEAVAEDTNTQQNQKQNNKKNNNKKYNKKKNNKKNVPSAAQKNEENADEEEHDEDEPTAAVTKKELNTNENQQSSPKKKLLLLLALMEQAVRDVLSLLDLHVAAASVEGVGFAPSAYSGPLLFVAHVLAHHRLGLLQADSCVAVADYWSTRFGAGAGAGLATAAAPADTEHDDGCGDVVGRIREGPLRVSSPAYANCALFPLLRAVQMEEEASEEASYPVGGTPGAGAVVAAAVPLLAAATPAAARALALLSVITGDQVLTLQQQEQQQLQKKTSASQQQQDNENDDEDSSGIAATRALISGYAVLPATVDELIQAFPGSNAPQSQSQSHSPHRRREGVLRLIVLDCRAEDSFLFARLPTALYIGGDVGYDNDLLQGAVLRLRELQGSHLTLLGTGRPIPEELNLVKLVALRLVEQGFQHLSIVEGGFKACIPHLKSGALEYVQSPARAARAAQQPHDDDHSAAPTAHQPHHHDPNATTTATTGSAAATTAAGISAAAAARAAELAAGAKELQGRASEGARRVGEGVSGWGSSLFSSIRAGVQAATTGAAAHTGSAPATAPKPAPAPPAAAVTSAGHSHPAAQEELARRTEVAATTATATAAPAVGGTHPPAPHATPSAAHSQQASTSDPPHHQAPTTTASAATSAISGFFGRVMNDLTAVRSGGSAAVTVATAAGNTTAASTESLSTAAHSSHPAPVYGGDDDEDDDDLGLITSISAPPPPPPATAASTNPAPAAAAATTAAAAAATTSTTSGDSNAVSSPTVAVSVSTAPTTEASVPTAATTTTTKNRRDSLDDMFNDDDLAPPAKATQPAPTATAPTASVSTKKVPPAPTTAATTATKTKAPHPFDEIFGDDF